RGRAASGSGASGPAPRRCYGPPVLARPLPSPSRSGRPRGGGYAGRTGQGKPRGAGRSGVRQRRGADLRVAAHGPFVTSRPTATVIHPNGRLSVIPPVDPRLAPLRRRSTGQES